MKSGLVALVITSTTTLHIPSTFLVCTSEPSFTLLDLHCCSSDVRQLVDACPTILVGRMPSDVKEFSDACPSY